MIPKKRARRLFCGTELDAVVAVVLAIGRMGVECATLGFRLGDGSRLYSTFIREKVFQGSRPAAWKYLKAVRVRDRQRVG